MKTHKSIDIARSPLAQQILMQEEERLQTAKQTQEAGSSGNRAQLLLAQGVGRLFAKETKDVDETGKKPNAELLKLAIEVRQGPMGEAMKKAFEQAFIVLPEGLNRLALLSMQEQLAPPTTPMALDRSGPRALDQRADLRALEQRAGPWPARDEPRKIEVGQVVQHRQVKVLDDLRADIHSSAKEIDQAMAEQVKQIDAAKQSGVGGPQLDSMFDELTRLNVKAGVYREAKVQIGALFEAMEKPEPQTRKASDEIKARLDRLYDLEQATHKNADQAMKRLKDDPAGRKAAGEVAAEMVGVLRELEDQLSTQLTAGYFREAAGSNAPDRLLEVLRANFARERENIDQQVSNPKLKQALQDAHGELAGKLARVAPWPENHADRAR